MTYGPEHTWPTRRAWTLAVEDDIRAFAAWIGAKRLQVDDKYVTVDELVERAIAYRSTDAAWREEVSRRTIEVLRHPYTTFHSPVEEPISDPPSAAESHEQASPVHPDTPNASQAN